MATVYEGVLGMGGVGVSLEGGGEVCLEGGEVCWEGGKVCLEEGEVCWEGGKVCLEEGEVCWEGGEVCVFGCRGRGCISSSSYLHVVVCLLLQLLTHSEPDVQKHALACLMTFKPAYLLPYK